MNNPLKYRDPDGLEEAGALIGKGDYPGQGITLTWERVWAYVYWSHNPDWIGTEQKTGSIWCLLGMLFVVSFAFSPIIVTAEAWWVGLSPLAKGALIGLIITLIIEGVKYIYRQVSEDMRYERIKWESGCFIFDKETEEILQGEKWEGDVHQVWVHIPGEGELGGHWEDDLDNDGVAASVDDDTDSEVGDEDPSKP